MSFVVSGDDQCEDGELQQSPLEPNRQVKLPDFSLSEEDGEIADSLDIKPPQARIAYNTSGGASGSSSSRMRRRDVYDGNSRHKRSDRHRDDDRRYSHREKHHEKQVRSAKDRESYHREKERYYREQMSYKDSYADLQYYREHQEELTRNSKHSKTRKKENREIYDNREERYIKKHKKERYVESKWENSVEDKALLDLKERIVSRHYSEDDEDSYRTEDHKKREYRENESLNSILQEKLLKAERETARQMEQVGNLEKQAKQKREEEMGFRKYLCLDKTNVVSVSDNSDNEMKTNYVIDDEDDDCKSVHTDDNLHRKSRSRSASKEIIADSDERSHSRSVSRERSCSHSPSSGTNIAVKDFENDKNEDVEVSEVEMGEDLPPYYPAIQGCRSVEEFQCLNHIAEGTYGVVYRGRDKCTEEIVALKCLKMEREKEGFPITSLREINTLLKGQHPNVVTVREIVFGSNLDKIYIVMDYIEHDLKSLMETMKHKKKTFTISEVKCLLKQLLCAVAYLHDNWILHRDLKTSNVFLSRKGVLKVGDFGLAREYGSPLKAYTPVVVTLWYRAPELLLCTKEYSTPIDMWSVGCIFGELLLMNPVFPGKSEVDQLNRVFKGLGTPNEEIWSGFNKLPAVQKIKFINYPASNLRSRFRVLSNFGHALLQRFLTYDPVQRITAEDALQHPYFDETPLPIDPSLFPRWPAKSELGHKKALAASPKPPSGGGEYKQLGNDEDSLGFHINAATTDNRKVPMGAGFSLKF